MQADKNIKNEWAAGQEEAVLSLPSDLQSPGKERLASIWSGLQTKNLKAVSLSLKPLAPCTENTRSQNFADLMVTFLPQMMKHMHLVF